MKLFFIALAASIGIFGKTIPAEISTTDNYNFTSTKMNFELLIPSELKPKFIIDENENTVIFKYENPGDSEPVFLFSINRISESVWIQVKDNLKNASVLSTKNGMIIYSETTSEKSLSGKNKTEFKEVLSRVNEVLNSFKEIN